MKGKDTWEKISKEFSAQVIQVLYRNIKIFRLIFSKLWLSMEDSVISCIDEDLVIELKYSTV